MKAITFFDTEIDVQSRKILDIGAIRSDGSVFHSNSLEDFADFLNGTAFICGHNIIKHDLNYVQKNISSQGNPLKFIDTLYLSPLLFPVKPYHSLLKDDKLQTGELNNPVNDSQKAKDLFFDEVTAFNNLDKYLKQIYFMLLKDHAGFSAFFDYVSFKPSEEALTTALIHSRFHGKICSNAPIEKLIKDSSTEFAYCLALINGSDRYSVTPPWVLRSYPEVEKVMHLLRNKPCITGCIYCDEALDAKSGLKEFFNFNYYRTFNGEPLQEQAVNAAINNKSLLAVFPTGGGKSLTFQVPALMAGRNTKGLTVVISPLQSLMKDQVDNLEKLGINES
ncbi:MAG: DEAD/DEAH box helicase, partial [Bacteroidota bacterium]